LPKLTPGDGSADGAEVLHNHMLTQPDPVQPASDGGPANPVMVETTGGQIIIETNFGGHLAETRKKAGITVFGPLLAPVVRSRDANDLDELMRASSVTESLHGLLRDSHGRAALEAGLGVLLGTDAMATALALRGTEVGPHFHFHLQLPRCIH
jgi:hypothetical protein